jgi:phosphatidylcholine synthase
MEQYKYSMRRYIAAWAVHLFTASTAVIGVLTLFEIYHHRYINALCLMGVAILIDAVDGTLARLVRVKQVLPKIDGALLDNIADFLNYVITPSFFLAIAPGMLEDPLRWWVISFLVISSTYQFTQSDAKTPDHFFKGFPCYWNIIVMYLYLFNTLPTTNAVIFFILCVMVFIPIKYVYPSRLDYLTTKKWLKLTMLIASILYGLDCFMLLWIYPEKSRLLLAYAGLYILFYITFSIFRTAVPLIRKRINS